MPARSSSGRRILPFRVQPDGFIIALIVTMAVASFAPARGAFVGIVDVLGTISVVLLFLLHGANLPTRMMLESLANWRFHTLVLAGTFLVFPALGLLLAPVGSTLLEPSLYAGLLFLCCLPSTVQSSIAFTSIAKGNVPAAVCTASASNLLGVFITPFLVGLLLARQSAISFASLGPIFGTIVAPFLVGQFSRPWTSGFISRHKGMLFLVDRGSVLVMVYAAFGKAVTGGIWSTVTPAQLALVLLICCVLLAAIVAYTIASGRILRLAVPDRRALLFCGSMKSLVTGVPMAVILFPAATAGYVVLPLMLFHQLQLLVFAMVARALGERDPQEASAS